MAQIIKQPNGRYGYFSTIVDGFLLWNVTVEEIIQFELEEQEELIRAKVGEIVEKLDKGRKPYFQFTLSWEEALEMHEENFGKLEVSIKDTN